MMVGERRSPQPRPGAAPEGLGGARRPREGEEGAGGPGSPRSASPPRQVPRPQIPSGRGKRHHKMAAATRRSGSRALRRRHPARSRTRFFFQAPRGAMGIVGTARHGVAGPRSLLGVVVRLAAHRTATAQRGNYSSRHIRRQRRRGGAPGLPRLAAGSPGRFARLDPGPGPGPGSGPSPGPNPSSSPGPAGRRCQGRAGARCHRVPSTNAASRRALRLMPALPHGLGAAGLPRDESLRDGARSKPACWKLPLVWQEVRTRCFFKFFSSPNRSDSQEFWFHGYHQTWLCMSSASVHGEDSQMCDAHREKPGWELTVGKWIRTALHRQRMSILTCSSCSQHPHSEKKKSNSLYTLNTQLLLNTLPFP